VTAVGVLIRNPKEERTLFMCRAPAIFLNLEKTRGIDFLIGFTEKSDPFHKVRAFHIFPPVIHVDLFLPFRTEEENQQNSLFFVGNRIFLLSVFILHSSSRHYPA
jgi:hypothetical protein